MCKIFCKIITFVFLVNALLTGCNGTVDTNTPLPTEAAEIKATQTLNENPPIPTALTGKANLYIIVSVGSQPALKYQIDVLVFSNDQLVEAGQTTQGVFVAPVNSGVYDVAIVYKGVQPYGEIQRNISVEPDRQNIVTFSLPPEGTMNTSVLMKSGKPAYNSTFITIVSDDQKIYEDSLLKSFVLRADNTYSVIVKHGSITEPVMTFTDEVKIRAEDITEKAFTLPYDETKLQIKVVSSIEAVNAFGVVITDAESGNIIYTIPNWFISSYAVLEAGKNYKVQVTYKESIKEKVVETSMGELELTFTYP